MRAVWSFWSKPYRAGIGCRWRSALHHLLAWVLSVNTARRHYPETTLITDRLGKKLLVDQLGLPFAYVSTELDRLAEADPGWWALGKLVAYSLQTEPFVHVDTDVFLWKPLPKTVSEAPVFTQCPESYANEAKPSLGEIECVFHKTGQELPPEWKWVRSRATGWFGEENCGILGGCQVEFLCDYAHAAVDLILAPEYAPVWSHFPDKFSHNFTVEQFYLWARIEFYRCQRAPQYPGLRVNHLFSSVQEACDANCARRLGFTHLWSDIKSHPAVATRLEQRVRHDYPDFYRRCERLISLAAK